MLSIFFGVTLFFTHFLNSHIYFFKHFKTILYFLSSNSNIWKICDGSDPAVYCFC